MKVVLEKGEDDIAKVFAAVFRNDDDLILEFVDSLSGGRSIEEKWVVVVSSQFGCPVGCSMCDTTGYFRGNPTSEELFSQVEYVVGRRFPDGKVPSKKFKVQFARMGEPALNMAVVDAIRKIEDELDAPGFMPCISTVAPEGTDEFFQSVKELNHDHFRGNFQLQFSIHSTDERQRDSIIPVGKWDLRRISEYGSDFFVGGRKIALNFALARENELDTNVIASTFPSESFMLKFTPVNPTQQARLNGLVREDLLEEELPQMAELRDLGFETVLSVGDPRENSIGSNCGQLAALWKRSR